MKRPTIWAGGAVLLLGLCVASFAASSGAITDYAMTKVIGRMAGDFFGPYERQPDQWVQVAKGVWWFNRGYDRSLVIDSGDGLVVVEPFSVKHARALSRAIEQNLATTVPNRRVKALIYSHHHLDHIRGGAELQPAEVIAPEDVPEHLAKLGDDRVLAPTRLVHGSEEMKVGRYTLQMINLGSGHGHSLYAFYIPELKLLYGPDLAFVRTVPPFGFPDTTYVDWFRQLDTALALPFDKFVPSHFRVSNDGRPFATRADVLEYREMMSDLRRLTAEGFTRYGVPVETGRAENVFRHVYGGMQTKYGDWAGFDQMMVVLVTQAFSGQHLGF